MQRHAQWGGGGKNRAIRIFGFMHFREKVKSGGARIRDMEEGVLSWVDTPWMGIVFMKEVGKALLGALLGSSRKRW